MALAVKDVRGHANFLGAPEFETYAEAMDYADTLNADMGLSTLEAWKIVASSMRHQYS